MNAHQQTHNNAERNVYLCRVAAVVLLGMGLHIAGTASASTPTSPSACASYDRMLFATCVLQHRTVRSLSDCPISCTFVKLFNGVNFPPRNHLSGDWIRSQGRDLAEQILRFKRRHPGCKIYLLGYCQTTPVTVTAAELLPRHTLEGIILFFPTLSCHYDLHQAARAVRGKIHVFASRLDPVGLPICIFGTSDRRWNVCAGTCGFRCTDCLLGDKVVNHTWTLSDCSLLNFGGHHGYWKKPFLRKRVYPLLLQDHPCPHLSQPPQAAR